jgi:hypothetical protein
MADNDDFGMGGIEDPDGYAVASAAGELSSIEWGAKVLKAVAVGAAVLWVVAVIAMFWNWWDLSDQQISLTTGAVKTDRLLQTVATTLQSTWGYALVGVLAYTGAMLLHGQRMRLLVAAMSDDD